jgi:radical SAM protein with 4Fe4S-binding SPASM domain
MRLADVLNLIKCITVRKILNISLVRLSYYVSLITGKPLVWGKPFFISLEPAAVCNLSCPQCPAGKGDVIRDPEFMDFTTCKAIIDEMAATTVILSLYHQGEPLLHGSLREFIRYAAEKKIYTITSTNGQLLTEEVCKGLVEAGLDRIIISLDGTDQESYGTYRKGGELEKVANGIRLLAETRQTFGRPYMIIQFLVFKHNQDQVAEIKRLGRELGADRVMIKSAQIEYTDSASEWLPDRSEYSRYKKNDQGEWMLNANLKNRCRRLWQTTVITSDGLIVPCCFDKLAKYPMGSIHKEGFSRIWKGRAYNDFRKNVLDGRMKTAICTNCTEGMNRIYL